MSYSVGDIVHFVDPQMLSKYGAALVVHEVVGGQGKFHTDQVLWLVGVPVAIWPSAVVLLCEGQKFPHLNVRGRAQLLIGQPVTEDFYYDGI